jgi:hypothetical protein
VNESRQRALGALSTSAVALGLLIFNSACDISPSIQSAQTAVTGAQTAVTGAQTAVSAVQTLVPGAQTALPGLQATIQAGATSVAGALADPQTVATQLQALLAGASIDLKATPAGASNDAVTQVAITGTDTRGTFGQLDPSTRQATAGAALQIGGQYFPNATISLSVVDSTGNSLLSGSKAPGQAPSIQ